MNLNAMEGNDWYNTGYTDYRNHYRGDDRPIDQDVFRGSYRFDNDSRHHDETTYDGFERRGQRHESSRTYDRYPDYQNRAQSFYYNDNQGRYQDNYRDRDNDYNRHSQRRNRQGYWQDEETHQPESMYRSTHVSGNFEDNYGPDSYRYHRGENYGNMAGSLSVGYDGDRNADWNENRHYNPLTGHRRSYHGNYTSRHPEQGNERYGRDFDRNSRNDYERY